MKIRKKILLVIAIVLAVIIPLRIIGYQIRINSEWLKIYNANNGYRAWTISYSDGHSWDKNGKCYNLWRFPKFYHCDVRKIMRPIPVEEEQQLKEEKQLRKDKQPPLKYKIISNGVLFKFRTDNGYVSYRNYNSKQEAVVQAWELYDELKPKDYSSWREVD